MDKFRRTTFSPQKKPVHSNLSLPFLLPSPTLRFGCDDDGHTNRGASFPTSSPPGKYLSTSPYRNSPDSRLRGEDDSCGAVRTEAPQQPRVVRREPGTHARKDMQEQIHRHRHRHRRGPRGAGAGRRRQPQVRAFCAPRPPRARHAQPRKWRRNGLKMPRKCRLAAGRWAGCGKMGWLREDGTRCGRRISGTRIGSGSLFCRVRATIHTS